MKNTTATKLPRPIAKSWKELSAAQRKAVESILAKKDNSEAFLRKLCTALKVTDLGFPERFLLANFLMENK